MRWRLAIAVIVVLLAVALLWLSPSREPASTTPIVPDISSTSVEPIHDSAAAPEPLTAEATPGTRQDPDDADATETAKNQTGPVLSKPKHAALAAKAETPSGPEVKPGLAPVTVLENMRAMFRQYSARLGGNPVGTNPEITAALNGGNPRQVVFLDPEDGMRINERGALVDNWGTPYFFHQLSRTEMEIHSAGPDRKMWTVDDLVLK